MLSETLFKKIYKLAGCMLSSQLDDMGINAATVSVFEGLLSFTLLSGSTKTFVREYAWSKNNELTLNLWDSILAYNHPVFHSEKFDSSSMTLTAASEH